MPFKDPERRREWERAYRPAYRARRRAEEARRREEEDRRRARQAELAASGLVPMRLRWPLEFADRSYAAGEVVWVLPGTAWLLERARLADEILQPGPTGVRVIIPASGAVGGPQRAVKSSGPTGECLEASSWPPRGC